MPNRIERLLYFGNPDGFWIRRLHTILLAGHGGGLVLMVSLMKQTADPVNALQGNIEYFTHFAAGLTACGIASLLGAKFDAKVDLQKEMATHLLENNLQIDDFAEEMPNFNVEKNTHTFWFGAFILLAGISFVSGVVTVAFL